MRNVSALTLCCLLPPVHCVPHQPRHGLLHNKVGPGKGGLWERAFGANRVYTAAEPYVDGTEEASWVLAPSMKAAVCCNTVVACMHTAVCQLMMHTTWAMIYDVVNCVYFVTSSTAKSACMQTAVLAAITNASPAAVFAVAAGVATNHVACRFF